MDQDQDNHFGTASLKLSATVQGRQPLELEALLKRPVIDGELRRDLIKKCLPGIKWNLAHVADEMRRPVSDIARLALEIGIGLLWSLPGIEQIREARKVVHLLSTDPDDRRFFDHAVFDLGTSESVSFATRYRESALNQCTGLASLLGLNPSTVRQLSLMGGLIHARKAKYSDRRQMVQILVRFGRWLKERCRKAERIKARVEKEHEGKTEPNEPTSW